MRLLQLQHEYSWGVDGYGRAHICLSKGNEVLLCMISDSGMAGVWMLGDQDNEDNNNGIQTTNTH